MSETAIEFYIASPTTPRVFPCDQQESAIEMEPRTLSQGQLQDAREAAVGILQNTEPDEALTIFTQGLRPVRSVREMETLIQNQSQMQNLIQKSQSIHNLLSLAYEHAYVPSDRPNNIGRIVGASSAPF